MGHLLRMSRERMYLEDWSLSPQLFSRANLPPAKLNGFNQDWCIQGTTLTIGRLYISFIVFTVTTRTFPFLPGMTSMIQARGHFIGASGSSRKHTLSPTRRLREGMCHLESYWDIWWTNIAIDVAQGPGTNANTVTKILNLQVTQYLAKLLGGLQWGNAQELGLQSHLQDVGGALEVLNFNMPLSALKQWWALQMWAGHRPQFVGNDT